MPRYRATASALALACAAIASASAQVKTTVPDAVPGARPATIERITIHGKALEGNLEGDAVDRPVIVFLPPSYASDRNRRYPVVYALHGYSIGAEQWTQEIHVPQTIEGAFARGAREMIVVLPDSKTVHNGSMYSSSVTTGDFETFIARDVVSYIDAHYRTIPRRESRGLVGHSMGGYGASRIGMKHRGRVRQPLHHEPVLPVPARAGPGQSRQRRRARGSQDARRFREAAVRRARAAGRGGRVVTQSEQAAALSRSAHVRQRAGCAVPVGGQRPARVRRSVRPAASGISCHRDRRRRHGHAEGRYRQAARCARPPMASRTRSRSTPARTRVTSRCDSRST